jgi:hypothetical protein
MTRDIYTRKPIVTDSEEHILPQSLGGRLGMLGRLDKTTNDKFGLGIDAALDEALRTIRVPLDTRNTNGDSPRSLTGVEGADGKKYRVDPGGVIIARPHIRTTKLETGGFKIEGTVPHEGTIRDMFRKRAREKGQDLDALVASIMASATMNEQPSPALTFNLNLWRPEVYRATAKIAANLFAKYEPDLFLSTSFDQVRDFVFEGDSEGPSLVQPVDADIQGVGDGPLDHLVKVEALPSGQVLGLVVYFGFLAFTVHLGSVPSTLRPRSYRVDQLSRRDRVDAPEDLLLPIASFEDAVAKDIEVVQDLALTQTERLLKVVMAYQERLWLERLIGKHNEKLKADLEDRTIATTEELSTFTGNLVEHLIKQLMPRIKSASDKRHAAARAEFEERVQQAMGNKPLK